MSETREYLRPSAKRMVMDAAVVTGDFVLASGVRATEKFDIDRIADGTEELRLCVNGLVNCIESNFRSKRALVGGNRYAFDAIGSVANGATRLGHLVCAELGARHIQSYKDGNSEFAFQSDFEDITKLLVLDDVYTSGTNMEKYRQKLPAHVMPIGGVVVLDRSLPEHEPQLQNGSPVFAAVRQVL